jgi:hypothetical protein
MLRLGGRRPTNLPPQLKEKVPPVPWSGIRGVIMGSADRIDHAVVESWAKESGTLETWRDCLRREELPPDGDADWLAMPGASDQ